MPSTLADSEMRRCPSTATIAIANSGKTGQGTSTPVSRLTVPAENDPNAPSWPIAITEYAHSASTAAPPPIGRPRLRPM
ncbi:hypothetical protein FHR93_002834 [Geodermatophilus sabuli]|uniref:Uncharacterized protein n=1 Tax=Geodermatophilus sabuli TaxID=1564158 RepID=A0A285EGK2_9ACTN|nr:hypothetical protein [Geodermatophilus sabuli]MBB3084620.1 hypothetical protein [Geodermatophilus sabuli]SNX97186.1 hypothetical protein SAMN06893097_106136 [Geodermatophilus sabuli]